MSFDSRGIFRSRCSFCSCDGYTAGEGSLKCVNCGHAPGKHEAINPFLPMPRELDGTGPSVTPQPTTGNSRPRQMCDSLAHTPTSPPGSNQSLPSLGPVSGNNAAINTNHPSQTATNCKSPSATTNMPLHSPQSCPLSAPVAQPEPLPISPFRPMPSLGPPREPPKMPTSTVSYQKHVVKIPADLELEFLEEPPESFSCQICANILREPQVLSCCGDRICKQCITKACQQKVDWGEKPLCPFCNAEDYKLVSNVDLMNGILDLKVRCAHFKDGCEWMGQIRDLIVHLSTCKFHPISCPNTCGTPTFQRQNLVQHLSICPKEHVRCPFSSVGCSDVMERTELLVHKKDNIHQHLLKILQKTNQVSSKCATVAQLLNTSCEDMLRQKDEKIAILKEQITAAENTVLSLQQQLCGTRQKIEILREDQEESAARHKHELEVKGEEVMHLRDQHREIQMRIQTLQGPQQAVERCTHIPVTFELDRFAERKMVNEKWLSPPFYTHPGGYKMCISVYPNGTSEGLGTYVSVFVHFMVGEYDDWLDWPFQGQIIILFLSQQSLLSHLWDGRRGHQHQVVYLDNLKSLNYRKRVTNGMYNLGWGTDQGLSHLKLGNFLQNDCLKVRVHAVLFLPL